MRILLLAALTASSTALAQDSCTLESWSDACSVDETAAVMSAATEKLAELGDCSQHKKKGDIQSCAAEATAMAQTLTAAGAHLAAEAKKANARADEAQAAAEAAKAAGQEKAEEAQAEGGPDGEKGGKAKRGNSNRMEAEFNDE